MATTLLAFDYGTKNIGVAQGQTLTGTGTELPPLKARDGVPNWEQVEQLLREWQPDRVLVGLPLNMDGSPSELSGRAKKFAIACTAALAYRWKWWTSACPPSKPKGEVMARGGSRDYKNNPVDSIAARLILETWLNAQAAER